MPSGFFLIRGPRRQVFIAGVEVKATSHSLRQGTFTLVSLLSNGASTGISAFAPSLRPRNFSSSSCR